MSLDMIVHAPQNKYTYNGLPVGSGKANCQDSSTLRKMLPSLFVRMVITVYRCTAYYVITF